MMMKVDILGTEYTIEERNEANDALLADRDGYCDKTSKRIVIATKGDDCELSDFDVYRRKCLRHEIIHAFLFESGLHENWEHKPYGHNETYVDWIAAQFPKMMKAFVTVNAI